MTSVAHEGVNTSDKVCIPLRSCFGSLENKMGTELLLRRVSAAHDHCQICFGVGNITRLTPLELPVLTGQAVVVPAVSHTGLCRKMNSLASCAAVRCLPCSGDQGSFPMSAWLLPWVYCTVLLQVRSILATALPERLRWLEPHWPQAVL